MTIKELMEKKEILLKKAKFVSMDKIQEDLILLDRMIEQKMNEV